MQVFSLQHLVGDTDIYLLDQIIKGRYKENDTLLDAGCGNGRNLRWFLINHINCYGVDKDPFCIESLISQYPSLPAASLQVAAVEEMPFETESFDHLISSAVLHFAENESHFYKMLSEMIRVAKPGASIFIRMTADIGIEQKVIFISDGVYELPDGTIRFLLTRSLLKNILKKYPVEMLEPLRTVNVNDMRSMTTLMLGKKTDTI